MHVFEIVIALLLGGAALTLLARKLGTPYPALVALAGAALALVPGTPTLVLDPELALTLFVAPVLLDSAFDASARDLRANWRAVAGLALGAVVLTVVVVAAVARWLVPTMPWAVAIALGAIVAPPDAAAATAVLKQLRPPQRLLVILEGESLFNDASALLIFRLAVGAAVGSVAMSAGTVLPLLLFVTVGSALLGYVAGRVILPLSSRVDEIAVAVVLQFCGCFGVWLLAERLHLSGILTVVVFAMSISRRAAVVTPARLRIPSYAVWEFAVFVLNVLAFILVGFQLKGILGRLDRPTLIEYVGVGGAVCAATILARIAWVSLASAVSRWRHRRAPERAEGRQDGEPLTKGAAAVVGWCGMRGIVTLATALALPTTTADGAAFPFRDLILFAAFLVVLGTLVVQGMTLRVLMKTIRLEDDGSVEREVRVARVETLRAALTATNQLRQAELSNLLRHRYEVMLRRAEADLAAAEATPAAAPAPPAECDPEQQEAEELQDEADAIQRATSAERQRLVSLRDNGTIGDAAFQRLEQELDLEELHLERLASGTARAEA